MDPHPGTSTSNGNRHVLMSDPPIGSDIKVEEIDNIIEYHCRDGNNFNMEFTNNLNSPPIDIEIPITQVDDRGINNCPQCGYRPGFHIMETRRKKKHEQCIKKIK